MSNSSATVMDECFEDDCSICLEAFNSQNPVTLTICKHEYHLQCILEWSQRSKECPVCWQLLVLKDPASQELLAAVEIERNLRSSNTSLTASASSPHFQDLYVEQDWFSDDSDFEERIVRHLAAVTTADDVRSREPQLSGISSSELLSHSPDAPNFQQDNTSPVEGSIPNSLIPEKPSVVGPEVSSSDATVSRNGVFYTRRLNSPPSTESLRESGAAEVSSCSNSFKSKWASVSARYKESISKSTLGLKKKLTVRNSSIKELSKGVKREMSAGIAGVARMFEKLDLTRKGAGGSSSNASMRRKTVPEYAFPPRNGKEIAYERKLDASSALLP